MLPLEFVCFCFVWFGLFTVTALNFIVGICLFLVLVCLSFCFVFVLFCLDCFLLLHLILLLEFVCFCFCFVLFGLLSVTALVVTVEICHCT